MDGWCSPFKLITENASRRVADYYASICLENGRNKVTAVHKANIMRMSDGLFPENAAEGRQKPIPASSSEEVPLDTVCLNMVQDPVSTTSTVMPNLR